MTDLTDHHVPQCEQDLTETYLCPACPGSEFDTRFQFNRHRRERHGGKRMFPSVKEAAAEAEVEERVERD